MKIRNAVNVDAARLLEIYAYYVENTAVSFETVAPSVGEFRERMEDISKKYPFLVLEDDGVIQGYAYADTFNPREAYRHSCELSIYLDRNATGRGYGRMLYEALEERLKHQDILNLYACIADPPVEDEYLTRNSESFHRHLGFTVIGRFHKCGCKFGRWYNTIYMEKIIGEHA